MALPPGIQAKTVTLGIASFADGSLATGRATVSMPVNVVHTPTNRPIFSSEITKPFVDGEVSFDLLPTDAPGLNRRDFSYKLKVEIQGATVQPEVIYFLLPAAGPDVVDLDGLVAVPSSAGVPIAVDVLTTEDLPGVLAEEIADESSPTSMALRAASVAALSEYPAVVSAAQTAVDAVTDQLDILQPGDPRVPTVAALPGYIAAVVDSAQHVTEMAVRDSDGAFPDWVLARWAPRLAPLLGTSRISEYRPDVRGSTSAILGSDSYVAANGEVLPVLPNMASWSIWGSSTAAGLSSRLSTLATSKGATCYGGGWGAERADHIAARLGSRPYQTGAFTIPASGPVTVPIANAVVPPSSTNSFPVTIAGVPGVIGSDLTVFTFTRDTTGSTVTVAAGTEVKPTLGFAHRADLLLLNIGKNDLGFTNSDNAKVIERNHQAFDYASPLVKRVLMIGHFVDTNTAADGAQRTNVATVNAALKARYGAQYLDLSAFLTGPDIWTATGIAPTQADLDQQALGNKPPSVAADDGHLNATGYDAVLGLIQSKLTSLGWIS